ncbi:mediator of RNA polymerase II transcription subunit 25-like isoform X1 [Planococcus citri]|uniref:mediator of RNA polymerase II transcription subunit 25-like isoform X1 n=1 Tax=Planococcus citri TaxID=170843 RepID=UPI0031F85019
MMTEQLCEESDQIMVQTLQTQTQTAAADAELEVPSRKRKTSTSSICSSSKAIAMDNDEDLAVKISRLLDLKLHPVISRLDEIASMVERQAENLASLTDRVGRIEDDIVSAAGANKTNEVELLQKQLTFFASPMHTHTPDTDIPKDETVWRGMLEWNDKVVYCDATWDPKNGDPEVKFDDWPTKLVMQVLPKTLISSVGASYMKNATSMVFYPTPSAASDVVAKKMTSGFAGCITLKNSNTPDCNLKVLILTFSPSKNVYLGFIPHDQSTFVKRLRSLIQQRKNDQKMGKIPASPLGSSSTPVSQTPSRSNNLATEMKLTRRDNLNIIHQLKQSLAAAQRKELQYQRTPRFKVKLRRPSAVGRSHTVNVPSHQQHPQPQQVRNIRSDAAQTATQFDDEEDVKFFV